MRQPLPYRCAALALSTSCSHASCAALALRVGVSKEGAWLLLRRASALGPLELAVCLGPARVRVGFAVRAADGTEAEVAHLNSGLAEQEATDPR